MATAGAGRAAKKLWGVRAGRLHNEAALMRMAHEP